MVAFNAYIVCEVSAWLAIMSFADMQHAIVQKSLSQQRVVQAVSDIVMGKFMSLHKLRTENVHINSHYIGNVL